MKKDKKKSLWSTFFEERKWCTRAFPEHVNEMMRFENRLKEDVFWKRKERGEDDAKAEQMISLTSGSRNNN